MFSTYLAPPSRVCCTTRTPSVSMSPAKRAEQPAKAHSCRVYLKLLNPPDFARNIITEFVLMDQTEPLYFIKRPYHCSSPFLTGSPPVLPPVLSRVGEPPLRAPIAPG